MSAETSALVRALLKDSLVVWRISGHVTPGEPPANAIIHAASGTVVSVEHAQAADAARTCAVQLLAVLKAELGDLGKVKRIVRVGGFVNCTEDFTTQSKVVNGASDLLVAVFGEAGKHARAAVGVNSLPAGAPVEIELIAELVD